MLLAFLVQNKWPYAQLLNGSVLLNLSLETRLKSESFEPLMGFLTFLAQE